MKMLILSRSENVHADMIAAYCGRHAQVDRLDFDFDNGFIDPPQVVLGDWIGSDPDAIFVHQPRISYKNDWFSDEIERKLFVSSWDSVKEWLESRYPDAFWVNRPSRIIGGRNAFTQLNLARELGFSCPETLFTNILDDLRCFAGSGEMVIKQGNLGVNLDRKRILTSLIDVNKIDPELLRKCPCLFQKYVPKSFELRVHVIGDTVLSCKIDSQSSEKTRIDWRDYDLENTPHEPYSLSFADSERCVELVKRIGLNFGILDLIVTPKGEIVFLECNSQGHWAWIEKLTQLPITETLCGLLLRRGSI